MISLHSQDLERAISLLLRGEVVAIPTETVYGLAAEIRNEEAIRKVFCLKERPFFDPLIVHVASLKQAKELTTDWSPLTDFLARYFWPGPLTLVLPKSDLVSSLITSGLDTVAVRFPKHDIAAQIITKTGPLAAPSANKFGQTSPTEAFHVKQEFKGLDVFVVDGGACEVGIESTVLEVARDQKSVSILRPGKIGVIELKEALRKWSHPVEIKREQSQKSPGHTPHHYVPSLPFAVLMKDENLDVLSLKSDQGAELKLSNEPEQAARELYSHLRSISQTRGTEFIYYRITRAQLEDSRWDAIFDRIRRASEHKSPAAQLALG